MKARLLMIIMFVSFIPQVFADSNDKDSFRIGTVEWRIHCNIGPTYSSAVRVTDYDMNKDSEKIEHLDIQVWSDYEDRIVNYVAIETGNNTGIFGSTIFYTTTDDSAGKRIRAFSDSVVFVKYVDYTLPNEEKIDITDTFVMTELSASGWRDDDVWKITYDPCMVEYLEKNKDSLDWFSVFYPAPLKQIESGLHADEIKCKDSLVLIKKYDSSLACVTQSTAFKLSDRGWSLEIIDGKSTRSMYHDDDLYCDLTDEGLSDQCNSLEEIVFGNARKDWTVYPGGAGWMPPNNSTLVRIYNEFEFGVPSLNFTAMLNDKIFVNKCESNGGVWNYTYHDCVALWQVCVDVGGIIVEEDITPPCTDTGIIDDEPLKIKVCHGAGLLRVSCVFEYEN